MELTLAGGFRPNFSCSFFKTPIFPSPPSRSSTELAITQGDSRQLRLVWLLLAFLFRPLLQF